jgi:hypothetical protein
MRYFESLSDFMQTATDPTAHSQLKDSRQSHNPSWTPQDYEGTIRAYSEGWPEGLRLLDEAVKLASKQDLAATPMMLKRFDVAGERPDAARAAAGEVLNMVRKGSTFKRKPSVKIVANIVAASHVRAPDLAKIGAAVVAQIDQLEAQGIRCELWAQIVAEHWPSGSEDKQNVEVCIKRPDEAVNLDRLAFVFINTGFFRRIWFRYAEQFECLPYGYGCADNRPTPGAVYIPHINGKITPEEAAGIVNSAFTVFNNEKRAA